MVRSLERTRLEPKLRAMDAISKWLQRFGDTLFAGSNSVHRVTLFQRRKRIFLGEILVPTHRYRLGRGNELKSRAWFPRGQGMAGTAWNHPRQTLVHRFPEFKDRASCRLYHRHQLKLSRWRAYWLSHRMSKQRWLFCFGIVDDRNETIAVLSIDSDTDIGELSNVQLDQIYNFAEMLGDYLSAQI